MQEADRHNVTDVFISLRSGSRLWPRGCCAMRMMLKMRFRRRSAASGHDVTVSMTGRGAVDDGCAQCVYRYVASRCGPQAVSLDDEGAPQLHDVADEVSEPRPMGQLYASIALALSPQQCELLLHRDRDGWSIGELAETYNLSEANVRTILSRARKAVREQYRKSQNPQL